MRLFLIIAITFTAHVAAVPSASMTSCSTSSMQGATMPSGGGMNGEKIMRGGGGQMQTPGSSMQGGNMPGSVMPGGTVQMTGSSMVTMQGSPKKTHAHTPKKHHHHHHNPHQTGGGVQSGMEIPAGFATSSTSGQNSLMQGTRTLPNGMVIPPGYKIIRHGTASHGNVQIVPISTSGMQMPSAGYTMTPNSGQASQMQGTKHHHHHHPHQEGGSLQSGMQTPNSGQASQMQGSPPTMVIPPGYKMVLHGTASHGSAQLEPISKASS